MVVANLGTTLSTPLVYLDYELRKDYIAKVLCIERDNPISMCNGKCYLYLQLGEAQPQDDESKVPPLRAVTLILTQAATPEVDDSQQWYARTVAFGEIPSLYQFLNLTDLLQPPQVLC